MQHVIKTYDMEITEWVNKHTIHDMNVNTSS